MDLTAVLLRVAARRPHVLVVPVPGAAAARLALEAAMARRGWPAATGPADADVLAVAGSPGPGVAAVVERIWRQIPAPRARIEIAAHAGVDAALTGAAALLADADRQRIPPPDEATGHDATGHDATDHDATDGDGGHAGHGGGAGEDGDGHSGHRDGHGGGAAHHGHHDHRGMELPGGLPMADLGEDRDGLTLDRLHIALGPVLPDWPAGLVVRVTLQGDVIQEAAAEVLDAAHGTPYAWPSAVARELDGLARFLGVAGWPAAAARARVLRDEALAGTSSGQVGPQPAALVRRIRRSRTLRWSIRGIPAGGADVLALLEARLAAVEALAAREPVPPAAARPAVDELAGLLVGAELAAARLIVAGADPDTDRAPVHGEVGHG
jgi:hypothetical protein